MDLNGVHMVLMPDGTFYAYSADQQPFSGVKLIDARQDFLCALTKEEARFRAIADVLR